MVSLHLVQWSCTRKKPSAHHRIPSLGLMCGPYTMRSISLFHTALVPELRVLSHLPRLVGLNRARVGFLSWCGSFGSVRMQKLHQKRTKQAYRDLLEEVVAFRRTLERFICGENAIRPQTGPTAKRTGLNQLP